MGRFMPPAYDRFKSYFEKQLVKVDKELKANEDKKVSLLAEKQEILDKLAEIEQDENK